MVLFNDTIYYNIAYGRLDAGREEVYSAAKQAAIHDQVRPRLLSISPVKVLSEHTRHRPLLAHACRARQVRSYGYKRKPFICADLSHARWV